MSRPKRLVVEFDNGTRKEIDIGRLSVEVLAQLATLGLVDSGGPAPQSYAVAEWENGWKEVVALDNDVRGLLRYYTIERTEEVGRLSFDKSDGYPQLILIQRLPRALKSLLLTGTSGVGMYRFQEKDVAREGGKTERILYDAKSPAFTPEHESEARAGIDSLKALAADELKKKGLDAARVASMDDAQRTEALTSLARAVGVRAMERQADLHGFLERLIAEL